MAIVNEVIVTGRVKRRLIDQAAKLWQRLSYWTKASDVEFDDGKTAEEKIGNINGITSDFSLDDENICASSSMAHRAHERFDEFTDGGRIVSINIGDDGKPYIVYKDGADTVLKKLGEPEIATMNASIIGTGGSIDVGTDCYVAYIIQHSGKYGNSIGVDNFKNYTFEQSYDASTGILTWKSNVHNFGGYVTIVKILR